MKPTGVAEIGWLAVRRQRWDVNSSPASLVVQPNTRFASDLGVLDRHRIDPLNLIPTGTFVQGLARFLRRRCDVPAGDSQRFPLAVTLPGRGEVNLQIKVRRFADVTAVQLWLAELSSREVDADDVLWWQAIDREDWRQLVIAWTLGVVEGGSTRAVQPLQPDYVRNVFRVNSLSVPVSDAAIRLELACIAIGDKRARDASSDLYTRIWSVNRAQNAKSGDKQAILTDRQGLVIAATGEVPTDSKAQARRVIGLYELGMAIRLCLVSDGTSAPSDEPDLVSEAQPWITTPDVVFADAMTTRDTWLRILDAFQLPGRLIESRTPPSEPTKHQSRTIARDVLVAVIAGVVLLLIAALVHLFG
jgi:hypothetical protein